MRTNLTLAENERVVVTGMGAVTPLGLDVESSWSGLIASEHGLVRTEDTPLAEHPIFKELGAKVIGAVDDFSLPKEFREKKIQVKKGFMHRSTLLGIRAVHEALSQAGLLDEGLTIDGSKLDPYRVGLYMGTTFAGMGHSAEVATNDRLRGSDLFKSLVARVATAPAMQFEVHGRSRMVGWECASGAATIDDGANMLLSRRSDMPPRVQVVVAGGTDAPNEPANLRYFEAIDAVTPSEKPDIASRPFDAGATGLVMAEGAGALVLETWEKAQKRGLSKDDILAELVGYASYTHAQDRTEAGVEGAVIAMREAAFMGKVALGEIIYTNAHATSTPIGDPIEARIIQEFVHREGLDRKNIWMNSTKGATGHTMGASGAIEAIFAVKALTENIVPPARNLDEPIEQVAGFNMSPHRATKLDEIDVAMSNSLGFGGGVTTLAFRKFEP